MIWKNKNKHLYSTFNIDNIPVLINLKKIDFIEKGVQGNARLHLGGKTIDLNYEYENFCEQLLQDKLK